MSNTNRNLGLIAKRWLVVIGILSLILGLYMLYDSRLPPTNDATLTTQHQQYLEKYETTKNLGKQVIQQGKGIDILRLSQENVEYEIRTVLKNIIVEYSVDPQFGKDNFSFDATLTLSKDCEILKEEYSKAKEFEEYKREYIFRQHMLSLLKAVFTIVGLYVVACLCYGAFYLTKRLFKLFKDEKAPVVDSDTDYPETPTG